jgi:hypothetical protein
MGKRARGQDRGRLTIALRVRQHNANRNELRVALMKSNGVECTRYDVSTHRELSGGVKREAWKVEFGRLFFGESGRLRRASSDPPRPLQVRPNKECLHSLFFIILCIFIYSISFYFRVYYVLRHENIFSSFGLTRSRVHILCMYSAMKIFSSCAVSSIASHAYAYSISI